MKNLLLLIFLLNVSLLQGQILSPEQMKSDLETVRQALVLKHPAMYAYTSEAEFEKIFKSIESSIDSPMSVRDFYVRVAPAIAALRCGHTKWLIPGKDMYYPFFESDLFPLSLFFHNGKAYINGAYGESGAALHGEVVSINGETTGSVIDRLLENLSFADGYSEGGKYYQLNNFFPGIYSTFTGTASKYVIVTSKDNEQSVYELPGVNLKEINKFRESNSDHEPFSIEILNDKTAWMDIDRFFTYPGEPGFRKFLKKSFRLIDEGRVEDLVIDLRGNEGGNEKWAIELYRHLAVSPFRYYEKITNKKPVKSDLEFTVPLIFRIAGVFSRKGETNNEFVFGRGLKTLKPVKSSYTGNLYLLVDGQTFSSASEFASRAKSDSRAMIIGTETSGGYAMNSSGFFTVLNLPASKIELGIPLLAFHMAGINDRNPSDRGVLPDLIALPTADQVISGNDYFREFAIGFIRESAHSHKQD